MAAEGSNRFSFEKQDLDDTISCCICMNVFTDPKALPCIHTFCVKCLQQTALNTNKGPGDEMPCPICRRQFKIPSEGFSGLPNNFLIAKIIQVANVPKSSKSSNLCEVCLEANEETTVEISKADMYCTDCKQKLCEECCKQHRKFKLNKNHKLIPINEQLVSDENTRVTLAPSVCERHEQRVLDIYCDECKTVECAICFIDGHRQHEGSHVNKYVDDFCKQIESNIETINGCSSKAQTKKEELDKMKEDMQQKVKRFESDVISRRDELKQFVDSQANSLMQSICSLSQSKFKEIQMEVDDTDAQISCLRSYSSYCQKMMAKGSPSDICREFSDLSQKAVELQSQCQSLMERKFQFFKVCFTRLAFEEFPEDGNIFGKIEDLGARTLVAEQKPEDAWFKEREQLINETEEQQRLMDEVMSGYNVMSDPVLVQTIKGETKKKAIRGLTILDNELFVVNEKSAEVEVYDSKTSSFNRRFIVENLIRPEDIASCNINKCLYIIDYKGLRKLKDILRVSANGALINTWSTGHFDGPFWEGSLSVTGETNVILTLFYESKLREYSSDGQLIREIKLSLNAGNGIRYTRHVIKLKNGDFLVCHGLGDDLHRVSIVDADGNLKNSFGGKSGSVIGQIDYPAHLAIDANGFVLVADRNNSRVLLLDSDFEFKREILSEKKHGLWYPTKVHLDESNGRLFVVDNLGTFGNDRKISIFDLNGLSRMSVTAD